MGPVSSRWHGVHCTWQPHRPWNCPRESTACRGYKEARTTRESRREKTQGGHRRIHRPPGQARLVKRLCPFGFDPMRGQQKRRPTFADRLNMLWWAVRGSACCAGGRCGASRLARCAGKCLRISSAPRPFGFDPMRGQQKRRPTFADRLNMLWWAVRGSNPGPWD